MACRISNLGQRTLSRRLAQRMDDGSGKPHHPWVETNDISSRGFQTRMYCVKTARVLHLHSECERAAALEAWWRRDVLDIQEQKALATEKTCRAAAFLELPHPVYQKLRKPAVISTDLLLVCRRDGKFRYEAQAIKQFSGELGSRAQRLLAIEQEVWRRDGVDWKLVMARGMHAQRSRNLAWLQQCENEMCARVASGIDIESREKLLMRLKRRVDWRVIDACRAVDEESGYEFGTSARAFRQLLVLRHIEADLNVPSMIFEPVDALFIGRIDNEEVALKGALER